MVFSIISFTKNGIGLAELLSERLHTQNAEDEVFLYTKCSYYRDTATKAQYISGNIVEFTGLQMKKKRVLVFIGACAIAVRAIAPNITDKTKDSPVIVIDELGKYVIPVLSGHIGGANSIALMLSGLINAAPVITTATDINHKFAVDVYAKKMGLYINNKSDIAVISSKLLSGRKISISVENGHLNSTHNIYNEIELVDYPPKVKTDIVISGEDKEFDTLMYLKPEEYVIGMGCKKDTDADMAEKFIDEYIKEQGIDKTRIYAFCTIDIKKNEKAFVQWTAKNNVSLITYTAQELKKLSGDFSASVFVENTVGVDNVCERAAMMGCGYNGTLICRKYAQNGMTIAIAKRKWSVSFDE